MLKVHLKIERPLFKTSSLELTAKLNQIETSNRVLIVQSDELQKKKRTGKFVGCKMVWFKLV